MFSDLAIDIEGTAPCTTSADESGKASGEYCTLRSLAQDSSRLDCHEVPALDSFLDLDKAWLDCPNVTSRHSNLPSGFFTATCGFSAAPNNGLDRHAENIVNAATTISTWAVIPRRRPGGGFSIPTLVVWRLTSFRSKKVVGSGNGATERTTPFRSSSGNASTLIRASALA